MSRLIRRPSADRDLISAFRHYTLHAGMHVANRFFAQAESTFAQLASMPGLGTRYDPDEPIYEDLRYFPVSGFRNYLIFYRPLPDGIEVFRVLHGARDLTSVLEKTLGIDGN